MEIYRDRARGKLFLTHKSYIEKILCILPQIEDELAYMSRVPYANAVSCLLYAMVFARPDIAHAIFRYLRGTTDIGLVCGSGKECLVTGYSDSNYVADVDTSTSMTGYVFTLGGSVVSFKSTLQSLVTLSTTEAEYMALTSAAKESIWFKGLSSGIFLARDQVHHDWTKDIDVRPLGVVLGSTYSRHVGFEVELAWGL
ncbi:secreted RxLR effector protein 161-like [Amaranthus tricolor]|uniref:secreted RxLR effector protein 161-like n=1 Tax=Amaranthus tricolor TaxID=29722 RepID=UPI002586DB8A|nr:secreted RxLR effector protein 161-like [Amaranthus tricolor]